jgi:hypothetical protein
MRPEQLAEDCRLELAHLQRIVEAVTQLLHEAGDEPTVIHQAAAANLAASFYTGVENIIKRSCKYHGIALPSGERWHEDLFMLVCEPSQKPLPVLIPNVIRQQMKQLRKFRHVAHHGYAFTLDWQIMRGGLVTLGQMFNVFEQSITKFLADTIKATSK